MLWDHLLGRLKREKDNDAHTLIDIKRAGSALECGKSPAAKSFSIGGGLTASYSASMGFVRPIITNYMMIELLNLLLLGYVIVGRTSKCQGTRWFILGTKREYFLYVKLRTYPLVGVWPPLMQFWTPSAVWTPQWMCVCV